MPTQHSVHGIKIDLLTSHVLGSEAAILEFENKINDFCRLAEDDYYGQVKEWTTYRWAETDDDIHGIATLTAKWGVIPSVYEPLGQSENIIGILNADGVTMDYDKLSESSKEDAHILDADNFVSSVKNAPADKRQIADQLWLDEAINRTPIYTSTLFARVDIEVSFLIFSAEREIEIGYEESRFPDGRVQIAFTVSDEIGGGIDVKGVELRAGFSGGLLIMHQFENRTDANAYMDSLKREINKGDLVGVQGLLKQSSSVESVIVSGGVYMSAESEIEVGKWLEVEANTSIHAGYGRDLVSDEHIVYFRGDAELRAEVQVGRMVELEGGIAFDFEGERRWTSEGKSYVDLELSLDVSVGADIDLLEATFPGLEFSLEGDLSGGFQVLAQVHLKLDDASSVEAWENFSPRDGSLDVGALLHRADVILQVSSVARVEFGEVDVEADIGVASVSVEAEAGGEVNIVHDRWVKRPSVASDPPKSYRKVEM